MADATFTREQGERFMRSIESLALVLFEVEIPALMITFGDGQAEISWGNPGDDPMQQPVNGVLRPVDDLRRYEDVEVKLPVSGGPEEED